MPEPKVKEPESEFVSRYMGSDEAKTSFPDQKQRLAVAYSLWRRRHRRRGKHTEHKDFDGLVYKLADGLAVLDAPIGEIGIDTKKMTATGIFSTSDRDRAGDIVDTGGIQTYRHRDNPVVLLNHAHLIGLAETPDGEYTVSLDGDAGIAKQVTYFSQKSTDAEQSFALICEGMLRGNSMGFKPMRWKSLRIDPRLGATKSNKLYEEIELCEVTWTPVPENAECIAPILAKGRLEGRPLSPVIKSMLMPFAPPKKVWANGSNLTTKEAQSWVSETGGGALVADKKKAVGGGQQEAKPEREVDRVAPQESRTEAEADKDIPDSDKPALDEDAGPETDTQKKGMLPEVDREPLSAETLRDLYMDLDRVHTEYGSSRKLMEHAHIGKWLEKFLDTVHGHREQIPGLMKQHHPDLPGLGVEEGQPKDKAESAEGADEVSHEADEEEMSGVKSADGLVTKSMSANDFLALTEAKDFMEEMSACDVMDKTKKAAMKYHAGVVKELCGKYNKTKSSDPLSTGPAKPDAEKPVTGDAAAEGVEGSKKKGIDETETPAEPFAMTDEDRNYLAGFTSEVMRAVRTRERLAV